MPPREYMGQPPSVPEYPVLDPESKNNDTEETPENPSTRKEQFRDFLGEEAERRKERAATAKIEGSKKAEAIARGEVLRQELKLAQAALQPLSQVDTADVESLEKTVVRLTDEINGVIAGHDQENKAGRQEAAQEQLLYENALGVRLLECEKLLFDQKKAALNKAQQKLEQVRAEERRILEDLKACEQDVLDGALGLYREQKNQDVLDPIIVKIRTKLEVSTAGLDKLSAPPPEAEPKNKALRVIKRIGKFIAKLFSSESKDKKESAKQGVSLSQMSETTIMIPSEAPTPIDRTTKVPEAPAQAPLSKEDQAAAAAGGQAYYDALAKVNPAYESVYEKKRTESQKKLNDLLRKDTISSIAEAKKLVDSMKQSGPGDRDYFAGFKLASGKEAGAQEVEKYIADQEAMFKTAEYNSNVETLLKDFSGDEAALRERLADLIKDAKEKAGGDSKKLRTSLLSRYLRQELRSGMTGSQTREAIKKLLVSELGWVGVKEAVAEESK